MKIQEMSICHQRRPCRAEVGKAWWLLCQPSPKRSDAEDEVVAALVVAADTGGVPQMWQTELMLQVTWCTGRRAPGRPR